jgi:hypothetical protein
MTSPPYAYRLTEEIARWAFEVHLCRLPAWHVAFRNPTAGPWKRVMALDPAGVEGEVHRFLREDDRPDLVLVDDALEALVIVEAKGALPELLKAAQVRKSCEVVGKLAATLTALEENPFWGRRAKYVVVPGLLWGAPAPTGEAQRAEAFSAYLAGLERIGFSHPGLVAVEARRSGDDVVLGGWADALPGSGLPQRVLESFEL